MDLAGNLAVTANQSGTATLQLANPHGDIVATCPDTTAATAPASYTEANEYGQPRTPTTAPTYGWHGTKQRSTDDLGGLTLMGVRLYNSAKGTFLSVDKIAGGNANTYTYPGDPINHSDLNGMCTAHTPTCLIRMLTSWEPFPPGFAKWLGRRWDGHGRPGWRAGMTKAGFRFMRVGGDHCSGIPDTFWDYNFINACDAHDLGYDLMRFMNYHAIAAKHAVNLMLYNDMKADCRGRFIIAREACLSDAWTFYQVDRRLTGEI